VVHAHAAFLWPTWRARRAAVVTGRPFVYSPRGMLAPELIRLRNRLLKRAWIALFERANLASATAIHVTSSREATALESLGLGPDVRVTVIPNGVETAELPVGIVRQADRVLYLGRLSPEKRVDSLIEAMALVPSARLTVAGTDGGSGYRAALEDLVERLGLRARVEFVGFADDVVKQDLLARSAVVALPSVFESFGNVVLEAMAHGCATIVAPGVGASEWVSASGGGMVVESERSVLAQALRRLMTDPQRTSSLGANGRSFVEEHLGWNRVAERMEQLYAQVVLTRPRDTTRRG
jgi:glycosyltransferase involved in cell wall biosynthesis